MLRRFNRLFIVSLAGALLACGGGSSGGGSSAPSGNNGNAGGGGVTVVVPTAPSLGTVTAGDGSATVSFSAPASNGGAEISGYTASCVANGQTATATGASSPLVVSGLTNGTSYACSVTASNSKGSSPSSATATVVPAASTPNTSGFGLSSPSAIGGTLPSDFTCDGMGSSPALSWTNTPTGTAEFALLMSTLPGDGTTKYNWVLYGIPAAKSSLSRDSYGVGTLGVGSDGPAVAYQPPCSQGLGEKTYTFTLYALSGSPAITGSTPVSGAALLAAIKSKTIASAALNLTYTRSASSSGLTNGCGYVLNSLKSSTTGNATGGCDAKYAYISSNGLATHTMMDGITATNLQVPTAQKFFGTNAWKIPLDPVIAPNTTSAVDGPIGIAINGVPIFNPCKQGGCNNGDTKVLGELDVCNGHAGRADDYHYHAAPVCLMAGKPASYWDTHPLGWALDGFAIFGYNNPDGTVATRDAVCGGNTLPTTNAPSGYSYHVTDVSPYILSCFRGVPSPDLAGQSAKYAPMRQPPVTPFAVSNMSLSYTSETETGVLRFSSSKTFVTTETGSDSYSNAAGTYRIQYRALSGSELATALADNKNAGKSACWAFQFTNSDGTVVTQPNVTYCR